MTARPEPPIAEAAADLDAPSGEWMPLSAHAVRTVPDLAEKLAAFEPLDHPAGHAAASFLKHEALDGATATTRLLVGPDRVEGFIATTFTEVALSRKATGTLRIRHRRLMPAFYLVWVAKHRATSVPGIELIAAAFGLGCAAAKLGRVVALVLDPWDEKVADLWKQAPYHFEESETKPRGDGVPRKLWTPLDFAPDQASPSARAFAQ